MPIEEREVPDPDSGKTLTAADIAAMDMETYAKYREQLLRTSEGMTLGEAMADDRTEVQINQVVRKVPWYRFGDGF